MKPIYVLNGPNLNLIGEREPSIYGAATLGSIEDAIKNRAGTEGFTVEFRQTNHEGEMIDWIQEARQAASALILNAGAYTHTSVAIMDALRALSIPAAEVHLSNIYKREAYRHRSYVSEAVTGIVCGFGARGYLLALDALIAIVKETDASNRSPHG